MGLGITITVDMVPDAELSQMASEVRVTERMGESATYAIQFNIDGDNGELPMLTDRRFDPGSMLSILAPTENTTHCLIKGPVTGHKVTLEHGVAGSTMEVQGVDRTIEMDRQTESQVWEDVSDNVAVVSICADYGLLFEIDSTDSVHSSQEHALVQRETDLQFIRRLARRNGFDFWITSDEYGIDTAHFKRPPTSERLIKPLIINQSPPNLQSIQIRWDIEQPVSIQGQQLDLNSLDTIEIGVEESPIAALGTQTLSSLASGNNSVHVHAPVDDAGDLRARGNGTATDASWFLSAACETSVEHYGDVIRPYKVISLQGAGSRYSGDYFVSGVTHTITPSEHTMDVELIRNAWGA